MAARDPRIAEIWDIGYLEVNVRWVQEQNLLCKDKYLRRLAGKEGKSSGRAR